MKATQTQIWLGATLLEMDVWHPNPHSVYNMWPPPDVAMLEVTIMCDRGYSLHGNIHLTKEYVGRLVYHTSQDGVTLVTLNHILYKLQWIMNL